MIRLAQQLLGSLYFCASIIYLVGCSQPSGDNTNNCNPQELTPCPEGWECRPEGPQGSYVCVEVETPPSCGDGTIDEEEACDGMILNGESCQSLGYSGGDLACTLECQFDMAACTLPYCMDPDLGYGDWPNDLLWEPNNSVEESTTLPCGDPAASDFEEQCQPRESYSNSLTMSICPSEDIDVFGVYLFSGDTLRVTLDYQYDLTADLDLYIVYHPDEVTYDRVGESNGLSDSENIFLASVAGEGWYFVVVHGKTPMDFNHYSLGYVINP